MRERWKEELEMELTRISRLVVANKFEVGATFTSLFKQTQSIDISIFKFEDKWECSQQVQLVMAIFLQ